MLLFLEKVLYQNTTAPVKGKKVSLKIHRANLIDRMICYQGGSFNMTRLQYFFLDPLTVTVGSDGV